MNKTVLIVIIVFITFLGIILFEIHRMRRQLRKIAADPELTLAALGYEDANFEDPYPFLLKIWKLHGQGKRPIGVYKRHIPEGEMFMYGVNMKPPTSDSVEIRTKITIVSPSLNLPHFSIEPISKQNNDASSGVLMTIKSIFSTAYSRKELKPIQLGIDEEFENTHVIQASDEAKAREFLTRLRLEQLKSLRRDYILECNETDFSIDDPSQEEQGWEYLVQAGRDAQKIWTILSSE